VEDNCLENAANRVQIRSKQALDCYALIC